MNVRNLLMLLDYRLGSSKPGSFEKVEHPKFCDTKKKRRKQKIAKLSRRKNRKK